jgi:hypothetical protein
MKKLLLATMLFLGTSMSIQNKSAELLVDIPKIDSFPKTSENFLKTKQNSYHPSMQESLDLQNERYTLEKISESDPTKIQKEPKYISEQRLDFIIDSLFNREISPLITKDFFKVVIKKESHDGRGYDINAYNKYSGARGLGQIMPETWKDLNSLSNFYLEATNPEENLKNSLKYLEWIPLALKKMNPGWRSLSKEEKLEQIIASYNWGIGKLESHNWNFSKAPRETQDYKKFIRENSNVFEKQI